MTRVVGVRFKTAGKVYYFDPGDFDLTVGMKVIVETARGIEIGEVIVRPKEVPDEDIAQPLKKVLRIATPEDLELQKENASKGKDAFRVCQERIASHELPMKLIDVEYTFDKSKVIFYFTAEKRVDFRNLVKDLAQRFRSRIELRQIGVRDEAKTLGGYGICGRPLCCATWITDFDPVSIRHAKEQNLSLNPSKISGVCGRLKCCLRFEADTYREIKNELPKVGDIVTTKKGKGKVVDVLIMRESVLVQLPDSGERIEVTAKELKRSGKQRVGA
jgi:Uncharacterized homolog of PSP1